MTDTSELRSGDERISELQATIRELGTEIDDRRARTAALLGAGVFSSLLALCGIYDIVTGKAGIWLFIGLSSEHLHLATVLSGVAGAVLLVSGLGRHLCRNETELARLSNLEQELAEMLSRDRSDEPLHTR